MTPSPIVFLVDVNNTSPGLASQHGSEFFGR
jgi:hypothetical protein